jgi:Leucine-rich repeat (LRR) protein
MKEWLRGQSTISTLKRIDLGGTRVTPSDIRQLKSAFPDAETIPSGVFDPQEELAVELLIGAGARPTWGKSGRVSSVYIREEASPKVFDALLDVKQCSHVNLRVGSDLTLERISRCANLVSVGIQDASAVSDAGVSHLANLPRLQSLSLRDSNVSDAGLAHLVGLERLSLRGAPLTGVGFAELRSLRKLTYLTLTSTQTNDRGLAHIGALHSLGRLTLDGTSITDLGLVSLIDCVHLTAISAVGTEITDGGIKVLQEQLPRCSVYLK